jgi:hypothetical protein
MMSQHAVHVVTRMRDCHGTPLQVKSARLWWQVAQACHTWHWQLYQTAW